MTKLLDGKTVIVTGAGKGIGRSAALLIAEYGAQIVAAGLTAQSIEETCAEIEAAGGRAISVAVDVADANQVEGMVRTALDHFGRLDGALNNAGIDGPLAPAADYPEDGFDRVIAVNLKGVWNCMRHQIKAMLPNRAGSIVNVASGLAELGQYHMVGYCASKAGVLGLTKAAALDYAAQGLRINALSPGVCDTPMMRIQMAANPGLREILVAREPIGRLGRPEEIGGAAVWLLSDLSSFAIGANILVDGGYGAI